MKQIEKKSDKRTVFAVSSHHPSFCVQPAEEERGVGEQEEKGGEPGHLPRALGR